MEDFDSVTSTYIKVGLIYRTDKLRPMLHLGHPYHPGASSYLMQAGDYKRELVQCFEELATGERFVVCANHFKSKSGGDSTNNFYNEIRVSEAQYLKTKALPTECVLEVPGKDFALKKLA